MRHPVQAVPAAAAVAALLLSLAVLLLAAGRMNAAGDLRRHPAAPLGIVSFEMAGSVGRAGEILAAWGPEGKRAARTSLRWDYPFILGYAAGLTVLAGLAGAVLARSPLVAGLAPVFAWAATAAGLLDALENVALQRVLAGAVTQPWPRLAQIAAALKFVALFGVGAFLVFSLVSLVVRSARPAPAP